jgi:hypothetical protein
MSAAYRVGDSQIGAVLQKQLHELHVPAVHCGQQRRAPVGRLRVHRDALAQQQLGDAAVPVGEG